ncbi:hypothetical protein M0R45_029724 [Rubus argutus]|uniref:CCHC-type domain-containing protein n=1 Tax=Rubus argutus TaxID=59490 RepID=A0AAW1W9B0_RUBAR
MIKHPSHALLNAPYPFSVLFVFYLRRRQLNVATVATQRPSFVFTSPSREEGGVDVSMQVVDGLKRARLEMDPRDIDNEPSSVFPAKSSAPLSFKASLIGTTLFDPTTGGLDDISRITAADCKVQELERGPSIQFSDKVEEDLCKPWRNTIVLKPLGRPMAYSFLMDRLVSRWKLKGPWWTIDDCGQYVAIQKWKSDFDASNHRVTHLAVWVRIVSLDIRYFKLGSLTQIGNLLGETVKVDLHTAAQARGKYARICVELDLSKPLRAEVQVKDTWYRLEYECMPTYCYSCGIVGHTQNNCPELNIVDVAAHSTLLFPGNVENIMSESLQPNTCATGSVNATDVDGKSVDATSKIGLGPWNDVVYKRNRKNLKGKLNSSGKNDTQGSRFQVLADEIEETHTVNGQMETVGTGSSLGKVWKKVQDKSTGKKK